MENEDEEIEELDVPDERFEPQKELERRNVPMADVERIVHIVLSHHGMKEWGSPVLPCSQEAMLVHMLDNLSAKSDTIENSAEMEFVGALGTRVVK